MSRILQLFFLFLGLLFCEFSLWSQDTISLTGEKLYADMLGSASSSAVIALTPELFLVAYDDRSSEKGVLKLGTITSDSVIQFRDSVDFVPYKGLERVSLSRLSPTRFIISFTLEGKIYLRAGEVIDQGLIEMGGVHTIKSGLVNDFALVCFSGNLFLTAYGEADPGEGKCTFGTVTEDLELSIDSTYTFATTGFTDTTHISMDTLSKTQFVISYGNGGGKSIIASMDEARIFSFGTPFSFATNQIHNLNVLGITGRKFVLVFNDIVEGVSKGVVILGIIGETGEVFYSQKLFFDDKKPSGISLTKLTNYEFIISYNGGWDDWYGYVVRATVLEDTVIFSDYTMFNPEPPSNSLSPITSLNNRDFLVTYLNRNSFKGYVRLGSTNEFKDAVAIESAPSPTFRLFPNPARDMVNLQWDSPQGTISVRILDLNGRILISREVHTSHITLHVGNYPKGIYLIQLIDGTSSVTRKLLIQ
jgi:hypothetical protein